MGGDAGAEDMEEMWNFDELDELEAEQSSSEGEAEPPKHRAVTEQSKEASDEDELPASTDNLASSAGAEGSSGGGVAGGGDLRGKLDFLFGEGGSESEEEEEEEDDWDEDDDAASQAPEARPKKKEKPIFEDPRTKWTNVEDQRLRGERVPLQERVRQRLTRLAEARLRGEPPGPPPPPPPGEGAEREKKRPSVASAALAEQPLPQRPAVREQRRARTGRIHENIELREKGTGDGEPVNHECRGVRSEGLPGVPAPVLLRHACRGSGASRGGFARPSVLALAMAEAQEATARVAARQAAEPSRCAKCDSPLERPMHCSQCLEVCYCSRECQRQDWKVHKRRCGRKGDAAPAGAAAARGAGALGGRAAGSGAPAAAGVLEEDAPDLYEQEAEAERLRQQEERQRLEEQRLARLEVERQRKEEARQEQARKDRARNAELRQQRLEEARRKAEKERQKKEAERAKQEEEARMLQEEAMRRAQEAEENARKKVEMKAYEDFLLAQLRRQELLDSHGGAAPLQQQPAAPAPAPAPAPVAKEPQPVKTPVIAANSAYNLYKRHQPSMGQRLAALGMDELRGF